MTVGERRLTVSNRTVLVGSCGVSLGFLELTKVVVQRRLVGVVRRCAVMCGGPHMTINGSVLNGLCHVVSFLWAVKARAKASAIARDCRYGERARSLNRHGKVYRRRAPGNVRHRT